MNNRLNHTEIVFVSGLLIFNGFCTTPALSGATDTDKATVAKASSTTAKSSSTTAKSSSNTAKPAKATATEVASKGHHATTIDEAMSYSVEALIESRDGRSKHAWAVRARSYLVSIPDRDSRLLWEAAILAAETDFERAAIVLSGVKNFDHGSYLALKLAAKTYSRLMRTDKALEVSSLVLKIRKDEEMTNLQAACYMSEKRYGEAASKYIDAAAISYSSANYTRAAMCYVRNNEPEKALVCVDKSFKSAALADLPTCYNCQGFCLERLNRTADAVIAFTKALDTYEKLTKASKGKVPADRPMQISGCLNERAKCYDKLGKTAEAERDRQQSAVFAKKVELELFGK